MTSSTTLRRSLLALAAMFAALLVAPATAHAHTEFDYSLPTDGESVGEPVEEITVAFTLPVTSVGNGFAVLDPQNNELAPTAVTDDDTIFRLLFDPPLADGTVAVKYEVQAEDGHILTGNFVFEVDAPVPTPFTASATPTTASATPTTASATPTTASATPTTASATLTTASSPDVTPAPTNPDPDEDEGVSGTWVLVAVAAAVASGAGAFVLVRSRTGAA